MLDTFKSFQLACLLDYQLDYFFYPSACLRAQSKVEGLCPFFRAGHRAMQIIPPAELYRSWYTFSTQQGDKLSDFNHYILVVINQSASDGLLIDETPIDRFNVSWINFDAPADDKVGGAVPIKSGTHIIRQKNDVPFGAYVYGYSTTSRCTYAYPAGLCLRTPSEQVRNPFSVYSS
jgi:IgGFc binding protein